MWTTTARVATTDPCALDDVVASVRRVLTDVDDAANRFRADSEISRLAESAAGCARPVSSVLFALLRAALDAAAATDGLVDPTIGNTLADLGYDRTIAAVVDHPGRARAEVRRPAGWRAVVLDEEQRTVTVPRGCRLDLGSTAKAWAADAAAAAAAEATDTGVLVSLGGDLALGGHPPADGWSVSIADSHRQAGPENPQVVLWSGALATSSTTTRAWKRGDRRVHHIIDPRTARPADGPWRTVSVAAASCVDANAAATAAIIAGAAAVDWLDSLQLPARLVDQDGRCATVAGWPAEGVAS